MSLHEKSLLVDLTLTGITTSRTDASITRSVLRSHQADDEAGRWVSKLWPKEALEPIRAIDSQIRAFHYAKTLPWLDKGGRICASRAFNSYIDEMRKLRVSRETLVREHFIDRYDYWLAKARSMRGHSFNSSEYPTRLGASYRFQFETHAAPVPHRDDFRITLNQADLDAMQADLDARLAEAEQVAVGALLKRIAEPISKLIERLADPDAKFQDSLIGNIRDLAKAIPDLNILDDPDIDALRIQIAALGAVSPENLRDSRSDRSRTLTKASSILATMAPWMADALDEDEDPNAAAA